MEDISVECQKTAGDHAPIELGKRKQEIHYFIA